MWLLSKDDVRRKIFKNKNDKINLTKKVEHVHKTVYYKINDIKAHLTQELTKNVKFKLIF